MRYALVAFKVVRKFECRFPLSSSDNSHSSTYGLCRYSWGACNQSQSTFGPPTNIRISYRLNRHSLSCCCDERRFSLVARTPRIVLIFFPPWARRAARATCTRRPRSPIFFFQQTASLSIQTTRRLDNGLQQKQQQQKRAALQNCSSKLQEPLRVFWSANLAGQFELLA